MISKPAQKGRVIQLSKLQMQELGMVKTYLNKRASDFEWESTTTQGLEPSSESVDPPLLNDVVAYRFEVAYVTVPIPFSGIR